jgi:hypothetical protein
MILRLTDAVMKWFPASKTINNCIELNRFNILDLRVHEYNSMIETLSHYYSNRIIISVVDNDWDGMDWIDLAQDRDQRRALVNTVKNLRIP